MNENRPICRVNRHIEHYLLKKTVIFTSPSPRQRAKKKTICLSDSAAASIYITVDLPAIGLSCFPDTHCAQKHYDYLVKHLACLFGVSSGSTSRCFAF